MSGPRLSGGRSGPVPSSAGPSATAGPSVPGAGPNGTALGAAGVLSVAQAVVGRLLEVGVELLSPAAELLAGRLMRGGTVYVFGTGHSRSVAMELAGRANGLRGMTELVLEDVIAAGIGTKDELADGRLERRPEAARTLLEGIKTGPQDAFVIISHSGCNGAPVEMAIGARRRQLPVVAITSLEHGRSVPSRHPSGARLYEVADVCIDTGAPYGDVALRLPSQTGVCSVSSFTGLLIAQALTAEIARCYLSAGVEPPLLASRNLP